MIDVFKKSVKQNTDFKCEAKFAVGFHLVPAVMTFCSSARAQMESWSTYKTQCNDCAHGRGEVKEKITR